jgi:hypothetical protein
MSMIEEQPNPDDTVTCVAFGVFGLVGGKAPPPVWAALIALAEAMKEAGPLPEEP